MERSRRERMKCSDLQNWLLDNEPGEMMVYKRSWWDHYCNIRDIMIPLFIPEDSVDKKLSGDEYFIQKASVYNGVCYVVGEHMSKSLKHPVLKIRYKGVEIIFRFNFYDYEIAVIGDVPIVLPEDFGDTINEEKTNFMYQGFPMEYKIDTPYVPNATTFIYSVTDDFQFYTFLVIMKATIDKFRSIGRGDSSYISW